MPRMSFAPGERVNMAVFAPTRFRLNSLCADLSIALNRRVMIDEALNAMIDNYRATAPELQESARADHVDHVAKMLQPEAA